MIAVWSPVHSAFSMISILLGFLSLLSCLWLKLPRFTLCVTTLFVLPFCLPNLEKDESSLRQAYTRQLVSFKDVKYVWGGENKRGIDCSGLARRAYRNALFEVGLKTFNGKLLRASVEQWLFDSSAKALSEGYRDFTVPVDYETSIKDSESTRLMKGDLAITIDGVHLLIYLGDDKWIQADPIAEKVISLHKNAKNLWFDDKVSLHRWSLLEKDLRKRASP